MMNETVERDLALPNILNLKGKRALVTGAASGIGRATAGCLAQLGADLILADRDPLDEVAAEVRALGRAALTLQGDLTDEAYLQQIIANGPYFSFAYVAGAFRAPRASPAQLEAFDFVMHVNVRAPMILGGAIIEQMAAQGGGYVVLVGSSAGRSGGGKIGDLNEYATYAASKGGVHTLTRVLSARGVDKNVLVNGIAPGVVRTPLMAATAPHLMAKNTVTPLGRSAEPEELAWPIALLCTPAASFMSGAIVDINGGRFVG
jgi:3-oxoacyl-[acyl-carrier protein] reductase